MKNYVKISFIIAFLAIVPFIISILRENEGREILITIKPQRQQTLREFILEQTDRNGKWTLTSPNATMKGNAVMLEKPILKIIRNKHKIKLTAEVSIYNKKTGNNHLKKVMLKGKDIMAKTAEGIFYGKSNIFKSLKPCYINIYDKHKISGDRCIIDFNREMIIISSNVKTTLRGKQ